MDIYLLLGCLMGLGFSGYYYDRVKRRLNQFLTHHPKYQSLAELIQARQNDQQLNEIFTPAEQQWLLKQACGYYLSKYVMVASIIGFSVLMLKHSF